MRQSIDRILAWTLAIALAAVLAAAPAVACDGPKADTQADSSGK